MKKSPFRTLIYHAEVHERFTGARIPVRNMSVSAKVKYNSAMCAIVAHGVEYTKALILFAYTFDPLGCETYATPIKLLGAVPHFEKWRKENANAIARTGMVQLLHSHKPANVADDQELLDEIDSHPIYS
jgi:hypothetical protein